MKTSLFGLRSRLFFGWILPALPAALLAACSGLWGGKTKADPDNCVVTPEICDVTQRCNLTTETCEAIPEDLPDLPDLPASPSSFIFPGGESGVVSMLKWPRDAKYALASLDPAVKLYYTTDGSTPLAGSGSTGSGVTPQLNSIVPGGTTIRWFGDYGPSFAADAVHSFTALTNPTYPEDFSYIPDPLTFNKSGGPVEIVAPGEAVTATLNVQLWSSTAAGYCPSCILQYVVSVDTLGAVLCIDGVQTLGPYPGVTVMGPVNFTAPMQPGRYALFSGITLEFSCNGNTAGGPQIGMIVVK